jgi:cell division septum initiation protein DivIVA
MERKSKERMKRLENDKFQDLVLNHLAKLTQDNTELKQELNGFKQEVGERFDKIESAVIRIENEQGEKIKALFDVREVQLDVNDRILDTLNRMEGKLDRLSLKVSSHESVLKQVK